MDLQTQPASRPGVASLRRGGGEPAISEQPPARIKRPRRPVITRIVIPLGLLAGLIVLFAFASRGALLPAKGVRVVPVVLKATAGDTAGGGPSGGTVVQAAGWIEPDPYPIRVTALSSGVVREVGVLEGEPVKAGQVIVRLIDEDARLALARAEAELAQREAELRAAQRTWDHPIELKRAVEVADAAVAETSAELTRQDAEVASQRARLDELADQLRRAEEGAASRSVSEADVVSRRLQHKGQIATVAAAEKQRDVLAAQLAQRQSELSAAKSNLELRIEQERALAMAKAGVALAQAARDEASLRLQRMTISAPMDGVVLRRHVEPGSMLDTASDAPDAAAAVHLYDPAKLQVRVDVPQAEAALVRVGMPAEVSVAALGDRTFRGTVTRAVREADIAKNTVQFKVRIEEPAEQLVPEMLARVRLIAPASGHSGDVRGSGAHVLFAPQALLIRQGDAPAAKVWLAERTADAAMARLAEIRVGGRRDGDWIEIESGLNPGDLLIAEPRVFRDGERIQIEGEAEDLPGKD